jgi:hypothetical protein
MSTIKATMSEEEYWKKIDEGKNIDYLEIANEFKKFSV